MALFGPGGKGYEEYLEVELDDDMVKDFIYRIDDLVRAMNKAEDWVSTRREVEKLKVVLSNFDKLLKTLGV